MLARAAECNDPFFARLHELCERPLNLFNGASSQF